MQRAISRIAEGRPLKELARHPDVLEALGITSPKQLPLLRGPPQDIYIIAGIRSGKSTFAAAGAIWASQTVDLTMLSAGEIPRFVVLSLSKDNAAAVMAHLLGALSRPRLKFLRVTEKACGHWQEIIAEGESDSVSSVFLWHPSGRPVEVAVVAGRRAGASVISRWLMGLCLDEAPRMLGSSDAIVNYDDSRNAAVGRLLPGAQIWSIGSPYQPYGPVYEVLESRFGSPTPDLIIFRARGPKMNPVKWTAENIERVRRTSPEVYKTDVEAEFLDGAETMFTQDVLKKCTVKGVDQIPYDPRCSYVAAMDPATRTNAWSLVVASRMGGLKQVVCAREWKADPLQPLSAKKVLLETAEVLSWYHLDWVYTDQWSADVIREFAMELTDTDGRRVKLDVVIKEWTEKEKINCFLSLAEQAKAGTLRLVDVAQLRKDLSLTKKMPTNRGPSIHLTKTGDGRHCDFAPSLARAVKEWIDEERPLPALPGSPEAMRAELDALEEAEVAALETKKAVPWWDRDPWEGGYEH